MLLAHFSHVTLSEPSFSPLQMRIKQLQAHGWGCWESSGQWSSAEEPSCEDRLLLLKNSRKMRPERVGGVWGYSESGAQPGS